MNYLVLLKSSIDDTMSLPEIIAAFEKMCKIPIVNDMILYETGTFSFTGEPLFYFSLVRQYPNNDDEYYQIHVDILFQPDDKNCDLSCTVWNDSIAGDIFDYIRTSKEFEYARSMPYKKIDIYIDET